jgi:4-hydroxybenzoate polyprenyltransferase
MRTLWLVIVSMRPRQWTKNGIVLAALVFAQRFTDPVDCFRSLVAVVTFCLLSGAVYLMNDVADRSRDREHPQKKLRPIASGALSPGTALLAAAIAGAAALVMAIGLDRTGPASGYAFTITALSYLVLQVLYTTLLKGVVILDVLVISAGFVLRAVAGAEAIAVPISSWLLICTFLLSVFLALCKRRHELLLLEANADLHRASLLEYSPALLDQMIAVVTSSTLVAYALYTLAEETQRKFGTDGLKFTIPFVLYGIFRYLYLVYRRELGGSPERALLNDGPLLINVMLYLAASVVIIMWAP